MANLPLWMIIIILLIQVLMGVFQWVVYHETVFTLRLMEVVRKTIKEDIATAIEANGRLSGVLAEIEEHVRQEVAEGEKRRARRKPARMD